MSYRRYPADQGWSTDCREMVVEDQLTVKHKTAVGLYSRRRVRDGALLLLTGVALYLCWLLARPFLAGITWALALGVVSYPLHAGLKRWLGTSPAALLSVIAVVIVLLAPGVLVIQRAIEEAGSGLGAIGQDFTLANAHETAERYPLVAKISDWLAARFDLREELKGTAGALASQASALLAGSMRMVTQTAVMLVALFFFLRDHELLLGYLRRLMPLSTEETGQLFQRVSDTIAATLYGNVAVKIVQGVLGGGIFWALGLPAPVLCGMAMALCAMLPIVGTSLIWGPAAIFLFVQGSWLKAMLLIAWGSLVISLIDNVLYPILIARGLRMHTLGILLSILGGLIVFGLAGVVLGPLIVASTTALLEIWRQRAEGESDLRLEYPVSKGPSDGGGPPGHQQTGACAVVGN